MIEQKPSTIEEAPSLADITSADDRVGKVDFTAKLGDRMSEEDEAARAGADDGVVSLTSMVRPQRPAGETATDDDDSKMPFILPPAKVDAAMTAEAERTKAEIAAARGELPEDEPEDDLEGDDEGDDEGDETATTDETSDDLGEHAEVVVTGPGATSDDTVTDESDVRAEKRSGPPEGLVISEVADLDAVAAAVAHLEAEEADRADAEEQLRLEAETQAAARAAEEALLRAAEIDAAELETLHEEDETSYDDVPLRTVNEVAGTVIAAMRRINEAHERHVESLELETARRCELLTAQAELDAELIRLHARREAHAIISAARARTGEHDAEMVETDQLGEIGETFSRFAETIETTVAPGPASPDHLRKS